MTTKVTTAAVLSLVMVGATPALAQDANTKTFGNHLAAVANGEQIRSLLMSQDYKNISNLHRDENGRWTGTAEKDGVRKIVSVKIPPLPPSQLTN